MRLFYTGIAIFALILFISTASLSILRQHPSNAMWIVYVAREQRSPYTIFRMRPDGSGVEPLTTYASADPVWSPDGRWIVFRAFDEGERALFVMRPNGKNVRQLTQNHYIVNQSLWSTDSQWILFSSQGLNLSSQYRVRPDGTHLQLDTADDDNQWIDPSLSPDGEWQVVSLREENVAALWILRAELPADNPNAELRQLTLNPGEDTFPAWSPDGEWIAFSSFRDGDRDIYRIRPDGSDLQQLTDNNLYDSQPSFSPIIDLLFYPAPLVAIGALMILLPPLVSHILGRNKLSTTSTRAETRQ